ncbi:hypothetical protein Y032_0568g62 [Ancylostoma ceylanicum]|uniref:Uncharacterized protein n=1 Tax=Ancylostoma ceylanicum TaxID=53326 RepID=A0A016WQE1_9BILA|nr:hypothetical protein Y032_0568g62 [Ancylostoma ceylanicum]
MVRYAINVVDSPSVHASFSPWSKLAKINKINESINTSLKMVVRSVISVMDCPTVHISIWIGAKLRKPIKLIKKSISGSITSCKEYPRSQQGLNGVPYSLHSLLRHLFQILVFIV